VRHLENRPQTQALGVSVFLKVQAACTLHHQSPPTSLASLHFFKERGANITALETIKKNIYKNVSIIDMIGDR